MNKILFSGSLACKPKVTTSKTSGRDYYTLTFSSKSAKGKEDMFDVNIYDAAIGSACMKLSGNERLCFEGKINTYKSERNEKPWVSTSIIANSLTSVTTSFEYNEFVLIGKVADMPTKNVTSNGTESLRLTIDCLKSEKDGNRSYDSVPVIIWDNAILGKYYAAPAMFAQGSAVLVKGKITPYTVSKNDKTYHNINFTATELTVLNNKNVVEQVQPKPRETPQPVVQAINNGFSVVGDNIDLPF